MHPHVSRRRSVLSREVIDFCWNFRQVRRRTERQCPPTAAKFHVGEKQPSNARCAVALPSVASASVRPSIPASASTTLLIFVIFYIRAAAAPPSLLASLLVGGHITRINWSMSIGCVNLPTDREADSHSLETAPLQSPVEHAHRRQSS